MKHSRLGGSRILVLGGAGFIGSNLVEKVFDYDPELVVVADSFFLGSEANLLSMRQESRNHKVVRVDATDYAALLQIVTEHGIDSILNFAVIPLPTSLDFPSWTVTTNVAITTNCCELVRQNFVERLVHISSSEVYGSASEIPMSESHPFNPSTPYAASKVASDQIVLSYKHTFGIDALIVRPFNNYGPKQNSGSYAGIIPIVIGKVLNNEPIEIFGDGEQTRDYVFVRDTAVAILELASLSNWPVQVVTVATGIETTVNRLVGKLLSLMGRENHSVVYAPARLGDVRRHAGDPSTLRELLGMSLDPLNEEDLLATIDWYEGLRDEN